MKTTPLHTETHANCTVEIRTDPEPLNPREEYDNLGVMVCWHGRYTLGDKQPSEEAKDYLLQLLRDAGEDTFVDGLNARFDTISATLLAERARFPHGYSEPFFTAFDEAAKPIYAERDALLAKHYVILPLYLYDHGGITMRCAPFSCGWDSGKVGFIFCSLEQARNNCLLDDSATWETVVETTPDESGTLRELTESVLRSEVETYDLYLTGQVYGYTVTHSETGEEDSCGGFYQDELPDAKDSDVLGEARAAAEALECDAAKEREERAHWEARDTVTVG